MKDIKLIVLFICFALFGKAQLDTALLKSTKPKTIKRMGKSAIQQKDPTSAILIMEYYTKKNKNDAEALQILGLAYMETRDYEKAQRTFMRAYNVNKEKAPESLYFGALMMKSNSKYDSAKVNFQKFKKEYKGDVKKLKRLATKEIAFCDSLAQLIKSENKIVIQHLDTTINKINTEGAPVNMNDNLLVFTSLRTEKVEYRYEEDTAKTTNRKLYYATRKGNKWEFKGEYGGKTLNDPGSNTGNASFSADRNRVYFTRCQLNMKQEMICAIYMSERTSSGWSEPVKLPKIINNPKYTSTMPAVTTDPAKGWDMIYFVSNRKGGKGGMDIWYTVYNKKVGAYRQPKNAGPKINTSQDEISPFYDTETRTLYYSSNGLGGFGGFDVFRSKTDGKRITGNENIGQPINGGADEVFYTISTNREEGFFVSNRKGGNALKNATCCDDIYYYKHTKYIHIEVSGTISDAMDKFETISNAMVEIYIKDKKTNEKFLVKTVKTDSKGNYTTTVEPNQEYLFLVKKDNYLGTSEELDTKSITVSRKLDLDLALVKKPKTPKRIPNLQYDYDRANISEGSKKSLDSTIYKLMITNPELIIEIQSHTDSKGTESYNEKLSQKRAESVVAYLISKGISKERLKAKGYGESEPIAPNENKDGSDNPAGRALNRRTDFKIVGVLDDELINEGDHRTEKEKKEEEELLKKQAEKQAPK